MSAICRLFWSYLNALTINRIPKTDQMERLHNGIVMKRRRLQNGIVTEGVAYVETIP